MYTRFFFNRFTPNALRSNLNPYKSFLRAAPSMTSAFPTSHSDFHPTHHVTMPKISVVNVMSNLEKLITSFHITNNEIVKTDVNQTALDSLKESLEVVKETYNKKRFSAARKQTSDLTSCLEEIYGNISPSDSPEIKKLAIEIYTYYGKAFQFGTLDQAELAVKAFEKAMHINPENKVLKENYESICLDLGIGIEKESTTLKR